MIKSKGQFYNTYLRKTVSKTHPKINLPNIQKKWTNSYAHERVELLRSIGINDETELKQLANLQYVELDSEIRYKLECEVSN